MISSMSATPVTPILPGSCNDEDSERQLQRGGSSNPKATRGWQVDEQSSQPNSSATRWLEEALRLERIAISDNLQSQHKALMTQWILQFELASINSTGSDKSRQASNTCEIGFQPKLSETSTKVTSSPTTDSEPVMKRPPKTTLGGELSVDSDYDTAEDLNRNVVTASSRVSSPSVSSSCGEALATQTSPLAKSAMGKSESIQSPDSNMAIVPSQSSSFLKSMASTVSHRTKNRVNQLQKWNLLSRSRTTNLAGQMEGTRGAFFRRFLPIVSSPTFELASAAIIIANTVVMCVRAQYTGRVIAHAQGFAGHEESTAETWKGAYEAFEALEIMFGGIYLLEWTVRFSVLQIRFVKSFWCWWDACIVGGWMFTVLHAGRTSSIDPGMLRILRLLRVVRLARILRTFEVFDTLHLLLASLKACCTALVWSLAFLTVIMMLFALVLCTLMEPHLQDTSKPDRFQVFLYFGTFARSMMSVWYMTLGNPAPIVWLLVDNVSEWFILVFLVHHAVLGFAIITVVRAIFLHETLKVSQTDQEIMIRSKERQIAKNAIHMLRVFESGDTDSSGKLEFQEFNALVRDPKMHVFLEALGLDVRDAEEVFLLLDTQGEGELSISTLMDGFTRIKGTARSIDVVQVMDMIRKLESDITSLGKHMKVPMKPGRRGSTETEHGPSARGSSMENRLSRLSEW